jgi:hypothetical protein
MIRLSKTNRSLECIHGGKTITLIIVPGEMIVLAQSNPMWGDARAAA